MASVSFCHLRLEFMLFNLVPVQETSFQLIFYALALCMFLCVLNMCYFKTFYYFFCKDAYRRST